MKNTLALLLMVFGISGCLSTPPEQLKASGEDFPILLTCELGALISYITLKDDGTGSAIFNRNGSQSYLEASKTEKLWKIRSYELKPNSIAFSLGVFGGFFMLNRTTAQASLVNSGGVTNDGPCFKGFKEYEKQL